MIRMTRMFASADARRVRQASCLWQDSGGPDNLVDEQFLSSLVLKQEVAWSYWGVVSGASAAARQISVVGMVSAITGRLYQVRRPQRWSARHRQQQHQRVTRGTTKSHLWSATKHSQHASASARRAR